MSVGFVVKAAAELAGDIMAVPEVCVNDNRGVDCENCAIRDSIGDR
jgi:hypothetical protein